MPSTSTRWSVYAGIYAFLCGALLLLPLGVVADALVEILRVPTGFAGVLVPGSGAIVGAVVWWGVVERRDAYTYLAGGLVGLLTALCTVLFWSLLVVHVFGRWAIVSAGIVVGFVLLWTTPVAVIAGLPLMYARLRLTDGRSGGTEPAV